MKLLRVVLALALALAVQAGLGGLQAQAHRYVDVLLIPVIWYGIAGSQRSGMLVGCTAGLIEDAWFGMGAFGLNGFKRTLLGWLLGGLGTRFDFNHPAGRFVGGSLASAMDSVMDIVLRRLLDHQRALAGVGEIVIRAIVSGILVLLAFAVVDRIKRFRDSRGLA